MTTEQLTDSETVVLRMQFRTMILFQYLSWDSYYRRIGQVLLGFAPGTGTTIHGISRVARIPRKTVRRKLAAMTDKGLVQQNGEGHYSHTEFGRSMHIRVWRDVMAVARGEQTGLSQGVLGDLLKSAKHAEYNYPYLASVKFDDNVNMDIEPKTKISRNSIPSVT
jgi:hypothetical protein